MTESIDQTLTISGDGSITFYVQEYPDPDQPFVVMVKEFTIMRQYTRRERITRRLRAVFKNGRDT